MLTEGCFKSGWRSRCEAGCRMRAGTLSALRTLNALYLRPTLKLASRCAVVFLTCLSPCSVPAQAQRAAQGYTQTLDTPSFWIRIEVRCPEGEVSCENVIYRGESKRTKKTLRLSGRTTHSMCADRVTPCRFLGYTFKNGTFTYFVSEGGELLVQDGRKVVLEQAGAWQ